MKQKPRWTLEMLTASLAVLCSLLVLVLLIQRPTAWPVLLALVVAWGICMAAFRYQLRRWLARRGFALRAETLCQAAGRWYAVMNAQYTGAAREPDGLFCLTGLTNGQPGCSEYYAVQNEKLKKYRLGLPEGEENEAVGKLIAELEHLSKL